MARNTEVETSYFSLIKRLVLVIFTLVCLALAGLWRIESERVDALRMSVIDLVMPVYTALIAPIGNASDMLRNFQSYQTLAEENRELRRELQRMQSWREAALQLEQENARLLDLNRVQVDPELTHVTGQVIADGDKGFRQSALINVGANDGIEDGWATMDGLGLVGRIAGIGENTARILLLTDVFSRVPARIQATGEKALVTGDNTHVPRLEFLDLSNAARPGDRVITSGDGAVFPPNLLIGYVVEDAKGNIRVSLAADLGRLEYLRVLRPTARQRIPPHSEIVPALPVFPAPQGSS